MPLSSPAKKVSDPEHRERLPLVNPDKKDSTQVSKVVMGTPVSPAQVTKVVMNAPASSAQVPQVVMDAPSYFDQS